MEIITQKVRCLDRWGLFVAAAVFGLSVSSAFAQAGDTPVPPAPAPPAPIVKELHGVTIGMTADEARQKLGRPKTADDAGMYFELGKNESAEVGLDEQKLVRTIAIIFTDGDFHAPSMTDVLGSVAPDEKKDDGSVYKM